jgi:hypothetical protein
MQLEIKKLGENKYLLTVGSTEIILTRAELAEIRVCLNRLSVF